MNVAASSADPVGEAVAAEELGFDFVSTSDHPCGTSPTFETWTMMAWMAAATSRITIASRVLGVPYRPPAMVAKMAETFSRLSGGRLILGLGGGYSDEEFRAFGLRVPTPREKVDGLADAITIARGLWSSSAFTHEGTVHRVESADIAPKPSHRIPIWVGTFGPRALDVTGRLADGWIPSMGFAPPEQIPAMRDRIFRAAEAAGRTSEDITLAYNVGADITVEELTDLTKLGFTAFNFMANGPEDVERLAIDVLPALKS
ncbi:LLM class flavin-dependent oxidoreductase [Nonomuraea sp. NPDC050556]|uniref:LLM class flavin-dependent oxidoreductase n=1 Tax=Nonomuraea sp. NPDC050556 TaxID=3364369 RepID=UPI00378C59D0